MYSKSCMFLIHLYKVLKMKLIDTHTHLYLKEFDDDRAEVVTRAINNGITRLLLPNINKDSIPEMIKMCRSFPDICKPMLGLHPGSVKKNFNEDLRDIEKMLGNDEFIAIGEIGIDLYWDKTFLEEQLEAFKIQIQWAKLRNLPVVIHARESFNEIFDVLDKLADSDLRGVFHSFTGNEEQVNRINEYGFYFGINGIITYKNNNLIEAVKKIPADKLLLETDSPYLTPVPKRGQRNESSLLIYIADRLSQIREISPKELALTTSRNAEALFKCN